MTEHDAFRQTLEGLTHSGEGLIQVAQGIIIANEGLQQAAAAALTARDEHTDLRVAVHRLETLVLGLVQQVRELRGERGRAMSVMVAELYEALRKAGVDEPLAREAARSVLSTDARTDLATKADLAELKSDLTWRLVLMTGGFWRPSAR